MAKFYFTNKAVEDLSDIWNYTMDEWSEAQADRYYEILISSCRKLAESSIPFGKKYEQIAKDLYGFKTNKHIIFYRTTKEHTIEVVRILHECMDLRSHIKE